MRKRKRKGKKKMKLLKNKKGFTLIELLAVIVVLAIIMVIATTQINNTIKKSRGDSFYDAVQMIERNAKMLCASSQTGGITLDELRTTSDIEADDEDYSLSLEGNNIVVTGKGQFNNMTVPTKTKKSITISGQEATISFTDCTVTGS